jgi:hypothetical protein
LERAQDSDRHIQRIQRRSHVAYVRQHPDPTYTITVKGDTFTGDALAVETDANTGAVLFSGPATFTATRMKLP